MLSAASNEKELEPVHKDPDTELKAVEVTHVPEELTDQELISAAMKQQTSIDEVLDRVLNSATLIFTHSPTGRP